MIGLVDEVRKSDEILHHAEGVFLVIEVVTVQGLEHDHLTGALGAEFPLLAADHALDLTPPDDLLAHLHPGGMPPGAQLLQKTKILLLTLPQSFLLRPRDKGVVIMTKKVFVSKEISASLIMGTMPWS